MEENKNVDVSKKNKNTIAVVGFIFSFLIPIVGFICCIIGLKKSKITNKNKALSIAGIIISVIIQFYGIYLFLQ